MKFYVTMIRGQRVAWLAGPFDTKELADAQVRAATDAAMDADPRAAFDAFGVTKLTLSLAPGKRYKPGVLNRQLGLPLGELCACGSVVSAVNGECARGARYCPAEAA